MFSTAHNHQIKLRINSNFSKKLFSLIRWFILNLISLCIFYLKASDAVEKGFMSYCKDLIRMDRKSWIVSNVFLFLHFPFSCVGLEWFPNIPKVVIRVSDLFLFAKIFRH